MKINYSRVELLLTAAIWLIRIAGSGADGFLHRGCGDVGWLIFHAIVWCYRDVPIVLLYLAMYRAPWKGGLSNFMLWVRLAAFHTVAHVVAYAAGEYFR